MNRRECCLTLALSGNQLAVFIDPDGLTTDDMARITREMNFSECTFVLPADRPGTDARVRIFSPDAEMPFAGHPAIGSTFALAHEGIIKSAQRGAVLGLGIGPTPLDLEWNGADLRFAWMTQQPPTYGPVLEAKERVASVGQAFSLEMDASQGSETGAR